MIGPGDDAEHQYSKDEERQLTVNLYQLLEEVHSGVWGDLNLACLKGIHRRIFSGVRGHAGRERSRDFGTEYLTFGPNRSASRYDVGRLLSKVFEQVDRSCRSFRENQDAPSYDEDAIHVSVWAQAEIIAIHPFQDGNGRSSRAFGQAILVSLGLKPIPVETCKQEYTDLLNLYFNGGRKRGPIEPLVDLYIGLYPL